MQIRHIRIRNFRGIRSLDWSVAARFAVLIGPGDSGKSTILEAVAFVLTPHWNLQLSDADFLDGDVSNALTILVTMVDPPPELIREDRFGHWLRGVGVDGSLHDEPQPDDQLALTIRLQVNDTLEPCWEVVREPEGDGARISASQRASLGAFRVGQSPLPHLRWSRDSALAQLGGGDEVAPALVDAHRAARASIFEQPPPGLAAAASHAAAAVEAIGGASLERPRPGLDPSARPRGGSLLLHDGEVPASNLGMGTQRLAGIAFQLGALQSEAVALIDELEIGLEPHRLLHLVRQLKNRAAAGHGQVIVTTHSPVVVAGVQVTDLQIVRRDADLTAVHSVPASMVGLGAGEPQATARSGAAAMLARRILVCEGNTEVGMCRGLVGHWDENEPVPAALLGTAVRSGGGSDAPIKARCLADLGYTTALLIDSDLSADDKDAHDASVAAASSSGVAVLRWSPGLAVEDQVAASLPRNGVRELIALAVELNESDDPSHAVRAAVAARLNKHPNDLEGLDPVGWTRQLGVAGTEVRAAIGRAANAKGWFKTETRGERLGELLARFLTELEPNDILGNTLHALREFVYEQN